MPYLNDVLHSELYTIFNISTSKKNVYTFYISEIDDISLKRQNILYFRQLSYFTVIRISKLIYTPKVLIAAALYWMIAKQKTICPLDLVINVTITDTNKIFSADKVITNFQRISRQH